MSAGRPLTPDEIKTLDFDQFAIKITIELSPSFTQGKTELPKEELLVLLKEEMSRHPAARHSVHLKALHDELSSLDKDPGLIPTKLLQVVGNCGLCNFQPHVRGYIYSSVGPPSCFPC